MKGRRLTVIAVIALLAIAAIALLASVARAPAISIGAGSEGSSAYRTSLKLKQGLERQGFKVQLVTSDQSLLLIDQLVDPQQPVDVTFAYGDMDAERFPTVESIGTVERLPMIFATMPGVPRATSLADIRGMRIDVGPAGSARERFVTEVLEQFGVTAQNSTFLHLPNAATYEEYADQGVQVLSIRWSDERPFLLDLALSGKLVGIPIPEADALESSVSSAEAMTIPIGAFRISPPVPQAPFPVIGQQMTVVANDDLSPAAVYAIASELTRIFSPGSSLSEPGEFPNFSNRQLPMNPTAAEYYATGQIPWQFENLPPAVADSFVGIVVLFSILLIAASVYSIFLPEVYSLWTGVLKPRSEERYIAAMERSVAEGRELSPRERQRLSEILERQDEGRVLRQRAETLRPQLSDPIDGQAPEDTTSSP